MEAEKETSSRSQTCLWPLCLLGILVSLWTSLRMPKLQNNYNAIHPKDRSDAKGDTTQEQVRFVPNTIPPPQQNKGSDKSKRRTPGWEKAAVLVALGILGVNAWQSYETRKAAEAAKGATELTREQLVGTQAAICFMNANIQAPPFDVVRISVGNRGHIISPRVWGDIEIIRKRLPGHEQIGDVQSVKIDQYQVEPEDKRGDVREVDVPVVGLDYAAVEHLKETVIVMARLNYKNGFGDTIPEAECLQGIGMHLEKRRYAGTQFMPCDKVPSLLKAYAIKDKQ